MLAITQFEVYVREHGRWTIHARYSSEQRKPAIMDARTTEFTTGLPTKVVRETYFPEVNESELVTVYVSPKARALNEASQSVRRQGRQLGTGNGNASSKSHRAAARATIGVRQFVMRGIVAIAFSLVAATLVTLLVSWALGRVVESGVELSPALTGNIVTTSYALLFLFFFFSLFRSRLPLHKLLTYLWQRAPAEQKVETPRTIADAIAPKLRPKRSTVEALAEAERALDELKYRRGDPAPDAGQIGEAQAPLSTTPPPLPPEPDADPVKPAAKAKEQRKKEEKKAAPPKQPTPEETPAAAEPQPASDPLVLERAVLQRFVTEVVRPAIARALPDDPVTRRGVSLLLAGAADAVSETARISVDSQSALLGDVLKHAGISAASATLFQHQYDALTSTTANKPLVDVGRIAFQKHLAGETVAATVAAAVVNWRTPFATPAEPREPATMSDDVAAPDTPPTYMLTELRAGAPFTSTTDGTLDLDAEAQRDAAMGLHNNIVRSALGAHAGHEIKHTGMGIFSRFTAAASAVAAARDIQKRFTAAYGPKLVIALIKGADPKDDPLLSPNIIRHAQTVASQACENEILAEHRIQREALAAVSDTPSPHEDSAATDDDNDDDNDDCALVKIEIESETAEPALYEHVPDRATEGPDTAAPG